MIASDQIRSAKILIVDDLMVNVELIQGILRVAGYTAVHATTDPNTVCAMHRENRYDLILLDLLMPGRDGFQVMEDLKELEPDDYLPVLVITAQPAHKLRALEAGAKDFISKPFDIAELRARVFNLLEVRLLHLQAMKHNLELEHTVQQLVESRENLRLKTLEERKSSEREAALARETHRSLLPRTLPQFENFHIDAFNNPTRSVGGDFYEFLQLGGGDWAGVLADASGKGMSAALLSSMTLGALNMELRSGTQPSEALNRLNKLLFLKSLPSQFVTLFLFILHPDGTGRFISAGHTPVYVYRAATGDVAVFESDSYMLGMFDFAVYRPRRFRLDRGDVLVVYSDGLIKAENLQRELFGAERLLEIVHHEGASGGKAVEQGLMKALEEFTGRLPQPDDITFVIVENTADRGPAIRDLRSTINPFDLESGQTRHV